MKLKLSRASIYFEIRIEYLISKFYNVIVTIIKKLLVFSINLKEKKRLEWFVHECVSILKLVRLINNGILNSS